MRGINITSLSLWKNSALLLDNVSACFPMGSATAILGPSGCGKSTLLKAVNRMHDERETRLCGSITLSGEELLSPDIELSKLRRRVGMVFQMPSPFDMSIEKNIAYGIRLHERLSARQLHERVTEALYEAALLDETKNRLGDSALSLSGGQQQRLCIARALAVRPEALLLDEPTSALDPLSARRIEQLIERLARRMTVVLVTHSPAQALRCCGRAVIMRSGTVCEAGEARRVLEHPKSAAAREYLSFSQI